MHTQHIFSSRNKFLGNHALALFGAEILDNKVALGGDGRFILTAQMHSEIPFVLFLQLEMNKFIKNEHVSERGIDAIFEYEKQQFMLWRLHT